MCNAWILLVAFLYDICSLWLAEPKKIIITSKIDAKSVYQRSSLSSLLAAVFITKVDDNAFLMLIMTFGGANGPFDWPDIITEPETCLCDDLLSCFERGDFFSLPMSIR